MKCGGKSMKCGGDSVKCGGRVLVQLLMGYYRLQLLRVNYIQWLLRE